jgi:hypothetical protein
MWLFEGRGYQGNQTLNSRATHVFGRAAEGGKAKQQFVPGEYLVC